MDTGILRGKYFNSDMIGDTVNVTTTVAMKSLTFTEYEAKCMKGELETIFERLEMLKQFKDLPRHESMLDSMINEFENVNGLEEECKLLRDAHNKLQNKLVLMNPIADWHFSHSEND